MKSYLLFFMIAYLTIDYFKIILKNNVKRKDELSKKIC